MDKRDWLLLIIGDYIEPIQIQKTMFKFAQEAGASGDEIYDFEPYNWGPCSFEIYDDLAQLRAEGLVETVSTSHGWNNYHLTDEGHASVEELRPESDPVLLTKLAEKRDWVTSRSFRQLLRDLYADYPTYASQSMFT